MKHFDAFEKRGVAMQEAEVETGTAGVGKRLADERERRMRAEARAARLESLQAVTSALANANSIQEIAVIIVHEGSKAVGAASGLVATLTADEKHLEVVYSAGDPVPTRRAGDRIPRHADLPVPRAFATLEMQFVKDRDALMMAYPLLATLPIQAEAYAFLPVQFRGRALGVISLGFETARAFDEDERKFLAALADHAAFALERARLYRTLMEEAEDHKRTARRLSRHLEARQGEHARWEALVREVPIGLGLVEAATGQIMLLNRPLLQLLQLAPTDGARRPAGKLSSPLDDAAWPVAEVLRTGEIVRDREVPLAREDGSRTVARVAAAPVRDREGRMLGCVVVAEDITRERAVETELRERQTLYEALLRAQSEMGDAIAVFEGHRIAWTNDAFIRLTGFAAGDTLDIASTFVETDHQRIRANLALAGDRDVSNDEDRLRADARRTDGTSIPVEASMRRISGDQERYVLILRDIRRQLRAEAELEAARHELATSEKLSAMGTLVAGVAHEIRTPLAYATNHLHLLAHQVRRSADAEGLPPSFADVAMSHLDSTLEGMDRINRLVADLRRFARQQPGEQRTEALDQIVGDAVRIFRAARHGQVDVKWAPGYPRKVTADAAQIQQVVLNLLENAADAMPQGGRVEVLTRIAARGCEIIVRDQGSGMPADVKARMFDPFFTTKEHGTGLGLGIVRRIIESHAGDISCESGPAGTTFTVTFPFPRGESINTAIA